MSRQENFRSLSVLALVGLFSAVAAAGQDHDGSQVQIAAATQGPAQVVRITLSEAQAQAAETPQARAARLSVDVAKYHRQAAAADYFPKVDSTFANLHFNKFMGRTLQLVNRNVGIPLLNKDENVLLFTVTQPLTPLFKVKQAVNIARADERIAEAKAAAAGVDVAQNVEHAYFSLLVAQRRLTEAGLKLEDLQPQLQVVGISAPPPSTVAPDRRQALLTAAGELEEARKKVADLTPSLNALIGFSPETRLELVPPEPLIVETVSLPVATQQALASSPELVEAEQTVAKAKAATRLGKLDYVPDVAVMAGYSYQTALDILPRDFSFLGVVATFTIFDFGKRERTVKERSTNLALAQLNLEAVKAKVSGTVQTTLSEVERARRMRDVTRQLVEVYQKGMAARQDVSLKERAELSKAESDMIQAELDFRLAYLRLKHAMSEP